MCFEQNILETTQSYVICQASLTEKNADTSKS